jgi:hypothetical protein
MLLWLYIIISTCELLIKIILSHWLQVGPREAAVAMRVGGIIIKLFSSSLLGQNKIVFLSAKTFFSN